jgi:uncharacterized protein (DUF58 family)
LALGWLLVALGLIALMTTGAFGGLWLALIGWFLIAAATAEGRQAQLRGVLADAPVREAMTSNPSPSRGHHCRGLSQRSALPQPAFGVPGDR